MRCKTNEELLKKEETCLYCKKKGVRGEMTYIARSSNYWLCVPCWKKIWDRIYDLRIRLTLETKRIADIAIITKYGKGKLNKAVRLLIEAEKVLQSFNFK
jgi:hypothetical protein